MYDVVDYFHIDRNAPSFGTRSVMTYEKMMDFEGAHTEASNSHSRPMSRRCFHRPVYF